MNDRRLLRWVDVWLVVGTLLLSLTIGVALFAERHNNSAPTPTTTVLTVPAPL